MHARIYSQHGFEFNRIPLATVAMNFMSLANRTGLEITETRRLPIACEPRQKQVIGEFYVSSDHPENPITAAPLLPIQICLD